jgi:hypothetical protein
MTQTHLSIMHSVIHYLFYFTVKDKSRAYGQSYGLTGSKMLELEWCSMHSALQVETHDAREFLGQKC